MKKTVFAVLITVAVAVLAACGNNDETGTSGAQFNDQDVSFAQGMIPHHEQAIEMAALAETRAGNPEVKDLAAAIKAAQDPEIKTMKAWLTDWDKPVSGDGMSGMDHGSDSDGPMDGMMSDADMKSLESTSGAEFDTMFLTMMIEHHEGAITMAEAELKDGKHKEALGLAKAIVADQSAEIATMKDLLNP